MTKPAVVKPLPQDHLPGADEDFEWTSETGVKIVLPPFNSIKPGIVRKTRKLKPMDQFFTTLEMICDESVLEKIDDLTPDEFGELQKAWFEHSGVDLGESPAS